MAEYFDPAEEKNETIRKRYIQIMAPLFFPDDPRKFDIVRLFSSLLRVSGMEDEGWDPYTESRGVLDDLYALMQFDLPIEKFKDKDTTVWRLGLLFYSHIVEMSAPYEVLANLLRFRLGKGYSPNPYYDFLTNEERKKFKRSGLYPKKKIEIIRKLSADAGLNVGEMFDEFHNADFRNAIAHSDFIFADKGFRCRSDRIGGAFTFSYEEVDDLITKAKVFIGTYFGLEREARRGLGELAGKSLAYDPEFKGILEVLVDEEGLMNGFAVHWPNGSESVYRRTKEGITMDNCMLDIENSGIGFFVGSYASRRDKFSPLVEIGEAPNYTPLRNGQPAGWRVNDGPLGNSK